MKLKLYEIEINIIIIESFSREYYHFVKVMMYGKILKKYKYEYQTLFRPYQDPVQSENSSTLFLWCASVKLSLMFGNGKPPQLKMIPWWF